MNRPDETLAQLFAEMGAADLKLCAATEALRLQDGLLNPALTPIFDRLSRKATRQIGDHNLNLGV